MSEFHLIQISDPHLTRRHAPLTDNFHRISEYIDAKRPDLVIDSGDMAFDATDQPGRSRIRQTLHAALPVACRYLPGNHDVGDNPTAVGPKPSHPVNDERLRAYHGIIGEDRWRFEAAGWCFIGLNSLVMNTGLAAEAEQFEWLAFAAIRPQGANRWRCSCTSRCFSTHPTIPNCESSAIRYVPMPARGRLDRDARRGRLPADRKRPCPPAPRFHLLPYPPHLGAFRRLRHFGCHAGRDRNQGDRTGGISLPAR